MQSKSSFKSLKFAQRLKKDVVQMIFDAKSSHLGGALSCLDVLSVLYTEILKINPKIPNYKKRDYFILSKGHVAAIVYATLANRGFFSKSELKQFGKNNSILSAHVSHKVRGVEVSTGSLGHGLPISIGLSIGLKNSKMNNKVYCMISDGELNCGSTWESIMLAGHLGLENLYCLIDKNNIQSYGNTKDIINLRELSSKFQNFGWKTLSCDGHNHSEIKSAFKNTSKNKNKPKALIFNTIKGKGIKNFENKLISHYRPPTEEELNEILEEN
tara:strand:- start:2271 stop:3083 length:813 start_codon:yes stop_codon:yes gene_type:complete